LCVRQDSTPAQRRVADPGDPYGFTADALHIRLFGSLLRIFRGCIPDKIQRVIAILISSRLEYQQQSGSWFSKRCLVVKTPNFLPYAACHVIILPNA
jgi:hypothetical protein